MNFLLSPCISLSLWWKYANMFINVYEKLYNGPTTECDHYYKTRRSTWITNSGIEHSIEERIFTYSKKAIVTLVLPPTFVNMLWLHSYRQILKHCTYTWGWCHSQSLINRKMISMFGSGSTYVKCKNLITILTSNNNVTKFANPSIWH